MRVESHLKIDRDLVFATASYGITLLRLLIAAFGAVTIFRGDDPRLAVASIVLVMTFDYFDGATFEKSAFSALKEWRIRRRVADSISDRLVIQIVCIPLLIKSPSFLWSYLPIVAREIAISGYISKQFAKGIIIYPRAISKVACTMVGITVASFLTFPSGLTIIFSVVMIAFSALALVDYVGRLKKYNSHTRSNALLLKSFNEIL